MEFSWDPAKRLANIQKHGMDFLVAYGLDWNAAVTRADLRHGPEIRLQAILPLEDRLYFVAFTLRTNTCRLINHERPATERSYIMRRKFRLNMPEEEAAIQAGIASDPDAQEWIAEDFAQARPAAEVVPELAAYALRSRNAAVKPPGVQVTLQLDRDVVDGLRAMGPDWQAQAQANQALRRLLETGGVAATADPKAANSPERP